VELSDWELLLGSPPRGKVYYFNPVFGDPKPERSFDYLMLTFPNDLHIEIQWDFERWKYRVSLTKERFDTLIEERFCDDAISAVQAVKELVEIERSYNGVI